MKKLVSLLGTIILVIWQLPQAVLGLTISVLLLAQYQPELSKKYDRQIYFWRLKSGISLSTYFIIVNNLCSEETIKHENGHAYQSLILGPLYLIVIGIPSFIWAIVYKYTNKSYYWFYTEAWADKLGGVAR